MTKPIFYSLNGLCISENVRQKKETPLKICRIEQCIDSHFSLSSRFLMHLKLHDNQKIIPSRTKRTSERNCFLLRCFSLRWSPPTYRLNHLCTDDLESI